MIKRALAAGVAALVSLAVLSTASQAQTRPTTFEDLAKYKGADRTQILVEGAKKEGKVTWYTTFVLQPLVEEIIKGFSAKYPDVKVEFFRASTDNDLAQRIISEFTARRYDVDVITPSGSGPTIAEAGILASWDSPLLADYPVGETGRDPTGRWVTITQYVRALGYNTRNVKPADVPKAWEDLLKPYWKGQKIVMSNATTVAGMIIGGTLDTWGEQKGMEYLKALGKQDLAIVPIGTAATVDQVAAGQYDACICAVHTLDILKAKGAPLGYSVLGDTYYQSTQETMLPKNPPHPHAALLFTDFLIDPEGAQKIMLGNMYLPQHPKLTASHPALEGKKPWVLTPARSLAGATKWNNILKEEFIR
jgi:iron(III) transport system substrate-binding protein